MKKVWFCIYNFPAAKTLKLANKLFGKYKFIKPTIEDDKCILVCHDMGKEPTSWILDRLIANKKFMGKFDTSSPMYSHARMRSTVNRYYIAACRFGYFDAYDWPDTDNFAKFLSLKLQKQLSGIPFYAAEREAALEANHDFNLDEQGKKYRRLSYIKDLVRYFNHTREEATLIIDREFPEWKSIKIEKKVLSVEEKKQRVVDEAKRMSELVSKLSFMSPKQRKKYLDSMDNLLDYLRFMQICNSKGISWVLENIGPVPGIT